MATITKDVREALVTVIKNIKTANGYNTNLVNARVFSAFSAMALQPSKDADYPKLFIVTDDGKRTKKVGMQKEKHYNFFVVFITKAVPNESAETLAGRVENFIDDLEKVIDANDTLSGKVTDVEMTEFTTDSGFSFPEGVAVAKVKAVTYSES